MSNTFVTDCNIDLKPLVEKMQKESNLILDYNITPAIKTARRRKLKGKKNTFKPISNKRFNYLNNNIK